MPLTENHASTGTPLTASEYDLAAHTVNAHQDVINQIPNATAVPNMHADFTTMSAIATPTSGGTATLTWNRTGATPVLASNRYLNNDTATGTAASHWTKGCSDAARIIWAKGVFEMTVGSTAGQTFSIVMWESNMPAGLLGALTDRGPAHVVFTPTSWIAQTVDTSSPGLVSTIASRTYTTPPGTAVQTVTLELDIAANILYVTGADGVRVAVGPDSRFGSVPAYFGDAEILYTAANTDGRVKVLDFKVDSVVGGRTQAAFYSDPLTTAGDLAVRGASATVRKAVGTNGQLLGVDTSSADKLAYVNQPPVFLHSFQNAWAVGQMGSPGYIDRARTFTKIRYVPSIPNTGSFTSELRDINTGSTFTGTSSGASGASVKYKEITGTFTFASGDMPYVYMTATSGTAGFGCDVWLIA